MTKPQPFAGLPDLSGIINQVTNILPKEVKDAISGTVGQILDPSDTSIKIGDPQPEGERPIPVEPGTKEMSGAVKALDTAISIIDALMKLAFVIPDQYEKYITGLRGALTTIRSWLD